MKPDALFPYTRILAYEKNNLEYADELMYQEMYTKELLLKLSFIREDVLGEKQEAVYAP